MMAIVGTAQPSGCRAPTLIGLTEQTAARRAGRAGCRLRLVGAALKQPTVQTVAAQTPAPGTQTSVVRLRLNPLCTGSAAPGPPPDQGRRRGVTGLVTGLFIEGGPEVSFSTPGCRRRPGHPEPGTIEVLNRGRRVLRSRTITRGRLVGFSLAAGRYWLRGRIGGGSGVFTAPVTIRSGFTTRRYVIGYVP